MSAPEPDEWAEDRIGMHALGEEILAIGGAFADDFVSGRRKVTALNWREVAAEIADYWHGTRQDLEDRP